MEREEPPSGDWSDLRNKIIIGLGFSAVVVAWMIYARPTEERPSGSGFNMGAGGPAGTGRAFAERPKTGLDMVSSQIGSGPPGVDPGIYRGMGAGSASASQGPSDAPTTPAAPPPAGDPAAMASQPASPPASPEDESKTLAGAGIPTDAKGLANLGAKEGMLSSLAAKLLDHPKVLAAIFNNKTVVNAFMNRAGAKENCENAGSLKKYLSDPNGGAMTKVFPVIQQALSRPETSSGLVSALAGTEMAKRVGACPGVQALGNDTTAIAGIAMSNPKALGLLMDPRGMAALASNPKAAGILTGLQSKVAGAP